DGQHPLLRHVNFVVEAQVAGVGRRAPGKEAEVRVLAGRERFDVPLVFGLLVVVALEVGVAARAVGVGHAHESLPATMLLVATGAALLADLGGMVNLPAVALLTGTVRDGANTGIEAKQAMDGARLAGVAEGAVVV